LAMIWAASNFSHEIRNDLSRHHKLVTSGVYAFCRHPSYLGFFAFAVGGQVLLGNFISSALFVFVLQKFFRERISIEEAILMKQYPKEYSQYRIKTWSGIPFSKN
jgi:protein-S-isoprenylcysteine O-methyltransferase